MTTFNVSVPEDKVSFFKEFLVLLGTDYTEYKDDFMLSEEQKAILDSIDKIPLSQYTSDADLYKKIDKDHGF